MAFVTPVVEHWMEREMAQWVRHEGSTHRTMSERSYRGATSRSAHWKEENVLINDVLNTFYLRLYGVGHMVNDHSDSERKPAAATWATLSD